MNEKIVQIETKEEKLYKVLYEDAEFLLSEGKCMVLEEFAERDGEAWQLIMMGKVVILRDDELVSTHVKEVSW